MPWIIPEAVNISAYNPISPNNNKKKPKAKSTTQYFLKFLLLLCQTFKSI